MGMLIRWHLSKSWQVWYIQGIFEEKYVARDPCQAGKNEDIMASFRNAVSCCGILSF
jgi:hypothetical protein